MCNTNEIHLNILLCVYHHHQIHFNDDKHSVPSHTIFICLWKVLCLAHNKIFFCVCFLSYVSPYLSAVCVRCRSVHFVLSNNLPSFIWLHWIEASSCCCYMVILKVAQNPWKMSKIATKWKWQATIKRVALCTMLCRCTLFTLHCCICLCPRLHTLVWYMFEKVFLSNWLEQHSHTKSVHVRKCARWSQSKCSQIYKWKCVCVRKKAKGNGGGAATVNVQITRITNNAVVKGGIR